MATLYSPEDPNRSNLIHLASSNWPPLPCRGRGRQCLERVPSRFVWAIRPKMKDAYPDLPKETAYSMLLVICQKAVALMDSSAAVEDSPVKLSEDLWKTVMEVSNLVQLAMQRDRMREDLKKCRFAADIGIRGTMLPELRFKWAREKMEEVKLYQSLDMMREQAHEQEEREKRALLTSGSVEQHTSLATENGAASKVTSLPERKGKIKFKIYGLNLSHRKWLRRLQRLTRAIAACRWEV